MIKYHQEYARSGTGLAYQISCYVMMRSISKRTGLEWQINSNEFKALRNTFEDLQLNVTDLSNIEELTSVTFDDELGFNGILELVKDNIKLFGYPTVSNYVAPGDNGDLFLEVKQELKFRSDIVEKCKKFRESFDGEVIAMHIRRGDFADISSGMFLCGSDYYQNALDQLPSDIPVLVFTNDKDSVIADSDLIASNPSRFTFITDLFNNNELIDCDAGQELDRLVDISGECRFDYKAALAYMAQRNSNVLTYDTLADTMASIVTELHPTYKEKLKSHSYNYSYDLCLMTMCDYVIMANSTFSMWGAELGNPQKVIYPKYWIQGHVEDAYLNAYEGSVNPIKTDLGDYNQTLDLAPQIIGRPHYYGLENPDPRSFTVVR